MSHQRIQYIDQIKGFAIFLVVNLFKMGVPEKIGNLLSLLGQKSLYIYIYIYIVCIFYYTITYYWRVYNRTKWYDVCSSSFYIFICANYNSNSTFIVSFWSSEKKSFATKIMFW